MAYGSRAAAKRGWLFLTFILVGLAFQNCAPGFSVPAPQTVVGSVDPSSLPPGPPGAQPAATPARVQPTPSSTPTVASKTDFYLGHTQGIDHFEFDPLASSLRSVDSAVFAGQIAGWLYRDADSGSILVPDAGSTNTLQIFARDAGTGSLSAVRTLGFVPAIVNLSVTKIAGVLQVFGASYDNGVLGYGTLSGDLSQFQNQQSVSFASGAHTHSSTWDSTRQLLYVSNLGLNSISIYRLANGQLANVGTVTVHNARTLVYDPVFDKLFVATEAYDGPSYIYSFAISENAGAVTLTNVGSLAMPMSGAELRVNRAERYVLATARNSGQESISGMPITPDGQMDSSRTPISIALSIAVPRVLELTEDGQYAMTATDVADGTTQAVQIYKMTFDANMNFVSAARSASVTAGTKGFISSLVVTRAP